jgi:hypothetical protein
MMPKIKLKGNYKCWKMLYKLCLSRNMYDMVYHPSGLGDEAAIVRHCTTFLLNQIRAIRLEGKFIIRLFGSRGL